MKKQFLTVATAAALFFTTACGSESSNTDQASTTSEMAHDEQMEEGMDHEGMMHNEDMEHQTVNNTAGEETAVSTPTFENITQDAKSHVQLLTKHYLTIKNALVASNVTEAKSGAASLLSALEAFNASSMPADLQTFYTKQAPAVKEAASSISNTTDLEQQRKAFGPLSQHLYALNKSFTAGDGALYQQYCPMANNNKGGYWLSAQKEVLNPYFGDKMLKCGSVKETL